MLKLFRVAGGERVREKSPLPGMTFSTSMPLRLSCALYVMAVSPALAIIPACQDEVGMERSNGDSRQCVTMLMSLGVLGVKMLFVKSDTVLKSACCCIGKRTELVSGYQPRDHGESLPAPPAAQPPSIFTVDLTARSIGSPPPLPPVG